MRKTILKLFFTCNHRYSGRMLKQVFWIVYKSWSYFQFLVQSLQVTREVRRNIKMLCVYLHLKLNPILHETDLSEGLNLSREIILQDSSLHILKFIFWNNLSVIYLRVGIAYKNTLHSSCNSCISRQIFLKIKNYQKFFVILHLPRGFNYID